MTLAEDIEKQIAKNARERARADTARELLAGRIEVHAEVAAFEAQRFQMHKAAMTSKFHEEGLPAGISEDVRRLAALPNIRDLEGRNSTLVITRCGCACTDSEHAR